MLDSVFNFPLTFALVVFRLAGMMLFAPLFGSARVPKRVRLILLLVLALGMVQGVRTPDNLPTTTWGIAIGIGGEMAFGLAMGMVMSFVFIAVQWAGEVIGQQMGFNLSEVLDPALGAQSSVIGDLYFMFTLVVFLLVGGHHAMLRGVRASFDALPLLSLSVNQSLLQTLLDLFHATTVLAIQLAAPVLVTMVIVDLVLGLIGRTIPQMNVMSAALSLRAAFGVVVILAGLTLTSGVIRRAVLRSMEQVRVGWTAPDRMSATRN